MRVNLRRKISGKDADPRSYAKVDWYTGTKSVEGMVVHLQTQDCRSAGCYMREKARCALPFTPRFLEMAARFLANDQERVGSGLWTVGQSTAPVTKNFFNKR